MHFSGLFCTLNIKTFKNDHFLHSKTTYFYPSSHENQNDLSIFDLLCKKRPTFKNLECREYDQQDRVGQKSGYPPPTD